MLTFSLVPPSNPSSLPGPSIPFQSKEESTALRRDSRRREGTEVGGAREIRWLGSWADGFTLGVYSFSALL
jgi:hypothetical protein